MYNRDGFLASINGLSVEEQESLIVRSFVYINEIQENLFLNNPEFTEVCNRVDEERFDFILRKYLPQDPDSMLEEMNLQDVEALFEEVIHPKKKKQDGVVYTPDYIVNYLLSEALSMVPKKSDEVSICDPACGSGGFLVGAVEILCEQGIDPIKAINEQIVGFDIDNNAVKFAKSHLYLYLLLNGHSIEDVSPRVYRKDTLLSTPESLLKKANRKDKFDIVGTNPPYVKLQTLSQEVRPKLLKKYSRYAKGSYSLALLFYVACQKMINKDGVVAMITQNNFFTSKAAENARKDTQESRSLRRVVDFSHLLVFGKKVMAYTCLLFLDANKEKETIEYRNMYKGVSKELLPKSDFTLIPYDELNFKKWRLADGPHRLNALKIERKGVQLGKLCSIYTGYATLRDKIYSCKEENGSWFWINKDKKKFPIEGEIIRRSIKVAYFDNEKDLLNNDGGMIYPYQVSEGEKQTILPEEVFKANFPKAYAHLLAHRDELGKRDKGDPKKQQKYGAWYGWGRTQGMNASKMKLLTKTFDSKPNFKLDRTDSIFCNGYAIDAPETFSNGATLSIKGLQKILNSRFMHYYIRITSFVINGGSSGYPCFQKNFIELFGIPILSEDECKGIEEGSVEEVEKILSKKYDIPLKHIDEYFGH